MPSFLRSFAAEFAGYGDLIGPLEVCEISTPLRVCRRQGTVFVRSPSCFPVIQRHIGLVHDNGLHEWFSAG